MKQRLLTAAIVIPVVLAFIWVGSLPFFIIVAAVLLIAQYEFYNIVSSSQLSPQKALCLPAGFLILASAYLRSSNMLLSNQKGIPAFVLTFTLAAILIGHLFSKNIRYFIESLGVSLAGIFMIPWLGSYFILLRDIAPYGKEYFIMMIGSVWIVDTAAYIAGSKYGKKKLAKTISPKKTVVGFIAGIPAGIAFAFLWRAVTGIKFLNCADIIVMGLIAGIAGQTGDLIESMVKRSGLVKDSGGMFPGHGGAYDRIDSLLTAAPLLYYYIVIFVR
ncbi:MAG: phosphatidate cytidylyltransferase [Elusimicrobiota bacterium]|nr:phosphatidate cytidylyltransferase [Elusimicrobiota bacterium]